MIDNGEADDKIICVMPDDPQFKDVHSLSDVNEQTKKEIEEFFSTYKDLEGKKTSVDGWQGKEAAIEIIKKSVEMFSEKATA